MGNGRRLFVVKEDEVEDEEERKRKKEEKTDEENGNLLSEVVREGNHKARRIRRTDANDSPRTRASESKISRTGGERKGRKGGGYEPVGNRWNRRTSVENARGKKSWHSADPTDTASGKGSSFRDGTARKGKETVDIPDS